MLQYLRAAQLRRRVPVPRILVVCGYWELGFGSRALHCCLETTLRVSAVSKIAVAADCSETASVFAEHDRDAARKTKSSYSYSVIAASYCPPPPPPPPFF